MMWGRGFKKCASRLRLHRPRVSLFASADAAWMLYELFQDKMAAPHSSSLCGALHNWRFYFPVRGMSTGVVATIGVRLIVASSVAGERASSLLSPSYDAQESFAPREFNAAMANVLGTLVYAIATDGVGASSLVSLLFQPGLPRWYVLCASAGGLRRS